MKQILFSIVIPTRNRLATLKHSLKTVTNLNYENYEVIISDNLSTDGTKKYCENLKDNRFKYFRTKKYLSMSHNWEFALKKTKGEFVFYLGDDDGMMKNSLTIANHIINKYNTQVLSWGIGAEYFWPGVSKQIYNPNTLNLSFLNGVDKVNSLENLKKIINFEKNYYYLPMIYNSFVCKKIINKILKKSKKAFFQSRTPDVYSGVVISHFTKNFIYSNKPLSIAGVSKKSNANNIFKHNDKNDNYIDYSSSKNIPFNKKLEFCPSFPVLTLETFLNAEKIFKGLKKIKYDIKKMIYVSLLESLSYDISTRKRIMAALIIISKNNNFIKEFNFFKYKIFKHKVLIKKNIYTQINLKNCQIRFNGNKIKLKNIFDASLFVEKNIYNLPVFLSKSLKAIILLSKKIRNSIKKNTFENCLINLK